MLQDRLPLNMSVASEPLLLPAYIEDCRMKLWEQAFYTYFRGQDSFKKSDDFVGFNGSDLVVRSVLFRYVSLNSAFVSFHIMLVGCSRILECNFVCVLVSQVL